MRSPRWLLVPTVAAALACAGVPGSAPVVAPGTPPGAGAPAPSAPAPPAPAPPADPAPVVVPVVEAVSPCRDDCLLLLEHRYADLAKGGYCALCGDEVEEACTLDWPSSDLMPCDEVDRLRNCLYARLGYGFETAPEWRAVFEREPWYQPDPGFTWSKVNRLQAANAETLKVIVRKRRCAR